MLATPLALGIDGTCNSVGVPSLALHAMQEELRFSTSMRALRAFAKRLPAEIAGPVLLGSGDFHHLSLPLIQHQSAHQGLRVLVLDNHPDNMRFLFGVHCGSWVLGFLGSWVLGFLGSTGLRAAICA